jgi:hypothetical protein
LIGSGFDTTKDTVYVNGVRIEKESRTFKSANLYEVKMPATGDPMLKFTVVQDKVVVERSIPNPLALRIAYTTVLGYDPPANNGPGVLRIKIDGAGFTPRVVPRVINGAQEARAEFVSGAEVIIRLMNPGPTIDLELVDPLTGSHVSTSVQKVSAAAGGGR